MKLTSAATLVLASLGSLASAYRPDSGRDEIAEKLREFVSPTFPIKHTGPITDDVVKPKVFKNKAVSKAASQIDCSKYVPIDQDGSDVSYFVNVQLGSNKDSYRMVLDTGSYYMWVYSENCTANACLKRQRFGVDNSSSIETTGHTYSISYTSGNIDGDIVKDQLTLGGTSTRTQFGTANKADPSFASFPIDGILGLSAVDKSEVNFPSLISVLVNEKQLPSRKFGVALSRASDGASSKGALILGDYDRDAVDGDFTYVSVQDGTALWRVPLDGAWVGGTEVNFGGNRNAIVDTGTTLLVLPPDDAMKFHGYIPNSQTDGKNFAIPCDSTVDVQIGIGGAKWSISPKDYIGFKYTDGSNLCASNVQGLKTGNSDEQWILGAVFLKNVYAVFDMDTKKVGFAKRAGGNNELADKCVNFVAQYQSTHEAGQAVTSSAASSSASSSASATSSNTTESATQSSTSASSETSSASSETTSVESSSPRTSNNSSSTSGHSPATTGSFSSHATGIIALPTGGSGMNTTLAVSTESSPSDPSASAEAAETSSSVSSEAASTSSEPSKTSASQNNNAGTVGITLMSLIAPVALVLCM